MPTKPKPMKTNSGDFMFKAGLVTIIGGTFAIAMFAIMSVPAPASGRMSVCTEAVVRLYGELRGQPLGVSNGDVMQDASRIVAARGCGVPS